MRETGSPILVTGSHRSGTTWVGRTISQHSRVRYVHEPFNITYPNRVVGLKLDLGFTHAESSSQRDEVTLCFDKLLRQGPTRYALATCGSVGMDARTPFRFSKHLMLEYVLRPRILVKDPIALLSAGWLHEKYNFAVICMVRNPLAFVGSLKAAEWDFDFENFRKQDKLMTGWLSEFSDRVESMCSKPSASDFLERAILLWNILHSVILEYQRQYPSWLFIKHEEISDNPKKGFREAFDYLNLDMNSSVRDYVDQYTSQENSGESTASYRPRNSKLAVHTWKERLSNEEMSRIRADTSKIASQLYENMV